ncbi:Peptidoglycan-binding lysin domain-containing protein [Cynara cardunculus var. scolymus]|uniref:Peptidoglycan-binding lysin domain-containing protein n=1 Tax=Cynara cardunculus var. scolymus TaxID=59895 RepID=A0A118JXG6_CYNCS|nr:Peptidoglycan-binding lysin domain-containing protein [Cynara cardunculus var. scolymus]
MARIDGAAFATFILMVIVLMVDGSTTSGLGIGLGPVCTQVVGAKDGDTCFAVEQTFNLTSDFFTSINPNLNCTALFIGQWLCISGIGN